MNLGQLIEELERLPADLEVSPAFGEGMSYRGWYDQIAFEPVEKATIGAMLRHALACDGATFQGYKGGDYVMSRSTPVNVAAYGCTDDDDDSEPVRIVERAKASVARDAAQTRADDLSRTVAAMGEALRDAHSLHADRNAGLSDDAIRIVDRIDAILSRPDVTAERGRWVPIEHYRNVYAERDAAIARAEKAEAEQRFSWQVGAAAERARDELGIQLAACQERLRLATYVIATLRADASDASADVEALRQWDAVPGDVLAHPTRHLEASGIDTDRVKEKA